MRVYQGGKGVVEDNDLERQGILFVVVRAECRYKAPARYDEELALTTRILKTAAA